MREDAQVPGGVPLSEEIFRLNLSYLLLAQRLLAQDEQQAAIALGVREPLISWLREASVGAVAALARSPVAVHELRLPKKASASVLAACEDARWLGPVHVAMTAVEATRGRSR
jgi:flagellar transcriptional activator FlhD